MNPTNLYHKSISAYLAQIYKSKPPPLEFKTISSHKLILPESGIFIFPKPEQIEPDCKTRYFITGISIKPNNDNLAQQQNDNASLKIICGGQTWISGLLGLFKTAEIKKLIIPLPAPEVVQEIELIIENSNPRKSQLRGSLNYDVVVAPNFHGDDLPCYQQIIHPLPENRIIYDGRKSNLGNISNRISRIEIYVPEDLERQPVIYCEDQEMKPLINQVIWDCETPCTGIANSVGDCETPCTGIANSVGDCETPCAGIHNLVSEPVTTQKTCYKTYSFDGTRFGSDSLIRLELPLSGREKVKYSIIENQVVRLINGYIGLAF